MVRDLIYERDGDFIYDFDSTNTSFLYMARLLHKKGIENCLFFLKLFDEDLVGVDPYDEDLDPGLKVKIATECAVNPFYFFREIARIPAPGKPIRFELNRGVLGALWCYLNDINSYLVMPRQHGKTWIVLLFCLWLLNFGGRDIQMLFTNKQLGDSIANLDRLRKARDLLPDYLRFDSVPEHLKSDIRVRDAAQSIKNIFGNEITVVGSANNPTRADALGRGLTLPILTMDEFAFQLFNDIIWPSAMPAWSKASQVAKDNGIPSSIMITTTPGDLKTPHGEFAYKVRDGCAWFTETLFDKDPAWIAEWLEKKSDYNIVYIEYDYIQLSHFRDPHEWFKKQCKELLYNWPKIRREVLIQWINTASASPFNQDDLANLSAMMIPKNEAWSLTINRFYELKVYRQLYSNRKYVIGIDPAKFRGEKADNSALVVVDALTGEACAAFGDNRMGYKEFFRFIYTLVTQYIPNSVIVVENNVGETIIEYLKDSPLSHLLYYEFSEDNTTEKWKKGVVHRSGMDTIVYGIATTRKSRPKLMEILFEHVSESPELLCIKELAEEVLGLEHKGGDRIEHSSATHDDYVFAYLMAQYVLRFGTNKARFGLFDIEVDENGLAISSDHTRDRRMEEEFKFSRKTDKSRIKTGISESPFLQELFTDFETIEDIEKKISKSLCTTKHINDIDNDWFGGESLFSKSGNIGLVELNDDAFAILNGVEKTKTDDIFGNTISNPFDMYNKKPGDWW